MKRIKNKTALIFLIVCILSLPGCKPIEKTEASTPVVSGKEAVQSVQAPDLSLLYGSEWENGLTTISFSKDGKVHLEKLEGLGEPYRDNSGNTALEYAHEGYIDGGYVIWVDRTDYLNVIEQRLDGDYSHYIKERGEERKRQQIQLDVITYVSDRTLVLDNAVYIRKK